MTNEWKYLNIKDLCNSIVDCVNKTAPTVDYATPYKMIRTTNVKNGWVDTEQVRYVEGEVYKKWTKRQVPQKGDVILTREAPLGEVGMIRSNEQVFLGQRLVSYRTNPSLLNNKFLLYSLRTSMMQQQIQSFGSGSTVTHMRVPDAEKLNLYIPDINTQGILGNLIGCYDDLIENNEKRIKILEEMAQRLYTEWFVNFKFPGHEKVKMVDSGSEYGRVPDGWEVTPIDQAIKISPRTKYEKGKPIRHVGMGCISETVSVIDISGIEQKEKLVGVKFQNKDTLFSRITPCLQNGKTAYVNFLSEGEVASGSTEFLVMREDKLTPTYIYLLSRNNDFRESAKLAMVGASGRQRVHAGFYKKYQVVVPPKEILQEFEEIVEHYFILSNSLNNRNYQLLKTRDLLIENLVTGERLLKSE